MRGVDATFLDTNNRLPYRRVFKNRRGFLSAISRMKDAEFLNAVDMDKLIVIRPDNLDSYRKGIQ